MNKKLKITLFLCFQAAVGIALGTYLIYSNDKEMVGTPKQPTLSDKFVSFEKDKDLEVYLDTENGCKYYKNFGLKYQKDAKTPDCNMKYVEKYKEKKAKK